MSSPKTGTRAGMARTDDDSWDITESVGQTALGVAWSRSLEAESDHPLFTDPYAQLFVDAAMARTRRQPPKYVLDRLRAIGGYAASRTKWFDEFFIAAGANGVDQAVILAAGLDARGWRLPWLDGTVLYEIDQPKVLAFKSETLARHDAKPSVSRYVAVPADLRHDWPKALREAGFDATVPTAWAAEGLRPYLPAAGQDLLFERIAELMDDQASVAKEVRAVVRRRAAQAEASATKAVSDAIESGSAQAINYFIAQKYVEAVAEFARSPNAKTILFPVEATQLIGTLGGIGELAKEAVGRASLPQAPKGKPSASVPKAGE